MSHSDPQTLTVVPGTTVIPPQGGGITLLVLCAIFIPLTILAVILRLYSRRSKRKSLALNDYLAVVAALLACVYAMTSILAVLYAGVGHHIIDVLPYAGILGKYIFSLGLMWNFANTAIKLSILHLYLTIFSISRPFRNVVYVVMALSVCYFITSFLQIIFLCQPIAYNWDPSIPGGHCANFKDIALSSGIINLMTDVAIVFLPVPMLWRLQMAKSRKLQIAVIFGIGFVICIFSIFRVIAIANLNVSDMTYSLVPDAIFSMLEPCLGTINCCLPVLQPVVARISSFSVIAKIKSMFSRRSSTDISSVNGSSRRRPFRAVKGSNGDKAVMLTGINGGRAKSTESHDTVPANDIHISHDISQTISKK